MKTHIGIDNGVSGTIGIITEGKEPIFIKTPVNKVQDYTKAKKIVSRVDGNALIELLSGYNPRETFVVMERPLVNPKMFSATASALRCHEAELTILETLGLPYQFVDSKEWQRDMLPKGLDTKVASLEIGGRLFPQFRGFKHPDRDGILMAEWARRKNF